MKWTQRMIAALLCILLCGGAVADWFTVSAHAAGIGGKWGDNLTWSIEDIEGDYTLTISGNGSMGDYTIENAAVDFDSEQDGATVWYELLSVDSIVIRSGVTDIADDAFSWADWNSLSSITIPGTVVSVGERAFALGIDRDSDRSVWVKIGNGVRVIGDSAFYNCTLTEVTIPGSVTEIGDNAFSNNRLTDVHIGTSVQRIGEQAFQNNKLQQVTFPDSVTEIGARAFGSNQLFGVAIPSSVVTIGEDAF